jgi:quercetin dioxygenase-like cupin family protein
MQSLWRRVACQLAIALAGAFPILMAQATQSGPSGGTAAVNYTLVIDPDATDPVQLNLPAAEFEENVSVSYKTRSPSVFVFQDYTMQQGTSTGWHMHPGIVLVTIADGSVEWYDAKCLKHIHKAGDFFTEDDQPHFVRNVDAATARLFITFVIAKGERNKIYQPSPPCALALDLR